MTRSLGWQVCKRQALGCVRIGLAVSRTVHWRRDGDREFSQNRQNSGPFLSSFGI